MLEWPMVYNPYTEFQMSILSHYSFFFNIELELRKYTASIPQSFLSCECNLQMYL